ncbi:Transporter, BCCT family [Desulfonema limicola]|uniref:Transporter, BCCT family n=1 Tax=Desulfonema limicola TaxID=45656 RepID=A0A975GK16_9BACT|nr:BCCT family transporter [Desulfonema limicola]QTA83368.1 Transporter, BCCT family [Desulfonema limicola]
MSESSSKIDHGLMWPSVIVTGIIGLLLSLFPEAGKKAVDNLFAFITHDFKWLFLLFGLFCVLFLIWLGMSKWGDIKLGDPEDEPEFSTYAWAAMIFCAGIGIAIVYWAFIEPVYYLNTSILHVDPAAQKGMIGELAGMYGQFHWGITPWAIYALPTFPIAYAIHVKKIPALRLSAACRGIIGKKADGAFGRLIDIVVIFAMIGGVGTSLGLAVPLGTALVGEITGLPESFTLQVCVLVVWTALFTITVWAGLKKGIAKLASINTYIAYFLLIYVFIIGPTTFILNNWCNSLGLMFSDFFKLSLWTDPVTNGGFPEGWTVFYWAWWVAYAPMMGLFVARISRGRTIRQVVFGELVYGSLGCWIFFAIWGGYAINLQTSGTLDVYTVLKESGWSNNVTIVAILRAMPGGKYIFIPVFTILCSIFLATTLNSAAYTLSSQVTTELSGNQEPPRWNRTLWGLILGLLALGLLSTGALKAVQLSSIIVALPMIPVLILMVFSLMKWLKEDYGELVAAKVKVLPPEKIKPVI